MQEMSYRGQRYVCVGVETYGKTPVKRWRTWCVDCGTQFEYTKPARLPDLDRPFRRCKAHSDGTAKRVGKIHPLARASDYTDAALVYTDRMPKGRNPRTRDNPASAPGAVKREPTMGEIDVTPFDQIAPEHMKAADEWLGYGCPSEHAHMTCSEWLEYVALLEG